MASRPELVIGFVAPVGVDVQLLCDAVNTHLRTFQYTSVELRLSKLLERTTAWTPLATNASEDARISHYQRAGREFRRTLQRGDALALAAIVAIREDRANRTGDSDQPGDSIAYLLNQLKHPDEAELLRRVYGPAFVLIAAHATSATREARLIKRIAESEQRTSRNEDKARAQEVIRVDDEEPGDLGADSFGQNTRNTYPLGDIFINLERNEGRLEVERFIDLLFGHPFHTPRPDELAMYHARAAALRSSDESRQVGAVITNVKRDTLGNPSNVELVASGTNEVPMRGGGFYWDGSSYSPDARDQSLIANDPGGDRAMAIKKSVLAELLEVLRDSAWLSEAAAGRQIPQLTTDLVSRLGRTQFMGIGEFQRQVHAEMAALVDSARRGVGVDGCTMYVTTFPCHNCAKHVIAAGIKQLIYLEPYAKSRAAMLHEEEIDLDSKEQSPPALDSTSGPHRVLFNAYTGIAPRQYEPLFSMAKRGRKNLLSLKQWGLRKASLEPRYLLRNGFASSLASEREEIERLDPAVFAWDREIVAAN